MLRSNLILALAIAAGTSGTAARVARGQSQPLVKSSGARVPDGTRTIDGIAARIEDDIITESEVNELSAFQRLVDGEAKSRQEVIRELADQWVVRQEAAATNYRQPSEEEVDRSYEQLVRQFHSAAEFDSRITEVGLSQAAVRRLLGEQLYLARFLDYRFRPAAQIDQSQIETYYREEFVPQLKARGETIPPVEEVEDTIREVLIQRAIDERATKWLDETRERLKIDILPEGAGP
jgi:hypothetical protein